MLWAPEMGSGGRCAYRGVFVKAGPHHWTCLLFPLVILIEPAGTLVKLMLNSLCS